MNPHIPLYTTRPDKHGRVVLVPKYLNDASLRYSTVVYIGQVTFYVVPEQHDQVKLATLYIRVRHRVSSSIPFVQVYTSIPLNN